MATTRQSSRSTTRSTGSSVSQSKEQLYNRAKKLKIEGRSKMSKDQLARAIQGKSR